MLTPQQFVEKWENVQQKERSVYTSHFIDVCQLVDHPAPTDSDAKGETFSFERALKKESGAQGFADVWYKGKFAVEYKGKDGDLVKAYDQLKEYADRLDNPPLLVVCNIDQWEIHTRFNGYPDTPIKFSNREIPDKLNILRALFYEPEQLRPDQTREKLTENAADVFKLIADTMRKDAKLLDVAANPERIARFLTKLIFCLFAEDVGLLPRDSQTRHGIFTNLLDKHKKNSAAFRQGLHELFEKMDKGGYFWGEQVPRFNGTLFQNVDVEPLLEDSLTRLERAARMDWAGIEPSVFGTLFERVLDENKRAQLGAHYTSRDDIMLIVEPVLMQPLQRDWEQICKEADILRQTYDAAPDIASKKPHKEALFALRDGMLKQLSERKVLDPACGSGNFLYVSLQLLMDMEHKVIKYPAWEDLKPAALPTVHPRQLFGMELDPIAHALASIVVWIGYIQRSQFYGYGRRYQDYLDSGDAVLEMMHDNIKRMDAIMSADGTEPEWEAVDVIVGNPPFLGDKKMRAEMGDEYVSKLRKLYDGRVPGGADLVTYWFEKARAQIEKDKTKRAGLLSTNSIRGGANRIVLENIKKSGDIFMAWADREWILDGAAVRVSMTGFDNGVEKVKTFGGIPAVEITPDLTASIDITKAKNLIENRDLSYIGVSQHGPFEIDQATAKRMLEADSKNKEVIKPIVNALEITRQSENRRVIDFEPGTTLEKAASYVMPFEYLQKIVLPIRQKNNRRQYREWWWIHGEPRPAMRVAIRKFSRFIVTPRVSKHRVFVWMTPENLPSDATVAIARDDDYFFGVLHSRLHEVWSLRMGTWLGKGNDPRYTPTTTFETFPFPFVPKQEDTESATYKAIAAAAKQLHEERAAWLSVGGKKRTLTNLYNALNVFRGTEKMKTEASAGDFAPRLDVLHKKLDAAVCAAYGWDAAILDDEESMLRKLLELNLSRAS